jgi:hypothetical protein
VTDKKAKDFLLFPDEPQTGEKKKKKTKNPTQHVCLPDFIFIECKII